MKFSHWGVFVLCNCLMLMAFYWCGRWEIPMMRQTITELATQALEQKRIQAEMQNALNQMYRRQNQMIKQGDKLEAEISNINKLFREIRSQQIRIRRHQIRSTSRSPQ